MKQIIKNGVKITIFLILTVVLIWELNRLFFYHDQSIWSTDSRVSSYKKLPYNSLDVLFVGSSHLMSGINPVQLWQETGIQSYNYCSRAQTVPFSYAYLKEALNTQSPKCVVLDVFGVVLKKDYNGLANTEFHFFANIDNISLRSKLDLLEVHENLRDRFSLIFPLFRNHNNYKMWENTEPSTDKIFMGYCFADTSESHNAPIYTSEISELEEMDDIYMRKIIELCQEMEIDLYMINTPSVLTDKEHRILNGVAHLCNQYGIDYYDMSSDVSEWEFDFQSDMMDATHVNTNGAVKVTKRIGRIMSEKYDFSDSHTHDYSNVWKNENDRMMISREAEVVPNS